MNSFKHVDDARVGGGCWWNFDRAKQAIIKARIEPGPENSGCDRYSAETILLFCLVAYNLGNERWSEEAVQTAIAEETAALAEVGRDERLAYWRSRRK